MEKNTKNRKVGSYPIHFRMIFFKINFKKVTKKLKSIHKTRHSGHEIK